MIDIVDLPVRAAGVPRDGLDRPLIVPKGGGKPKAHTRTTTFIDCIEDKANLATWGKRCVLVGAARRPEILGGVSELDPEDAEDKRKLNAIAERANVASGAHIKRDKGTYLHALSELVDEGRQLPEGISPEDLADMAAYKMATINFNVKHSERIVVVAELCNAGTPDRVSYYTGPGPLPDMWFDDELFITDLKTGDIRYGALKMASQLADYAHGEFYDHTLFPVPPLPNDPDGKKALAAWKKVAIPAELAEKAYSSIGPVNQEWGVIFNLRPGSAECTLHWVDLTIGWEAAKHALKTRELRSRRHAMRPWRTNIPAQVENVGETVKV